MERHVMELGYAQSCIKRPRNLGLIYKKGGTKEEKTTHL